jgi:putative acetyltransferase
MRAAFEDHIERALREEIDQIPEYYAARGGGFWVAEAEGHLVGTFGLERVDARSAELRRMYVALDHWRRGVGRAMLAAAERECLAAGAAILTLSTSELQPETLALYRAASYRLLYEEVAATGTSKTVGAGLRRFFFEKALGWRREACVAHGGIHPGSAPGCRSGPGSAAATAKRYQLSPISGLGRLNTSTAQPKSKVHIGRRPPPQRADCRPGDTIRVWHDLDENRQPCR